VGRLAGGRGCRLAGLWRGAAGGVGVAEFGCPYVVAVGERLVGPSVLVADSSDREPQPDVRSRSFQRRLG
jgi:hypothetical protein